MYVGLTVKKDGLKNLIKALDKADGSMLEWGLFSDSGTHTTAEMPMANLMAIHEFRDDQWRRPLFHIQAAKIADGHLSRKLHKELKTWVLRAATGRSTPITHYLGNFGSVVVKDAKSMFGKRGISYKGMTIPANSPAWGVIKGHSRPLYHTGQLQNAVKFTTHKKGSR